MKFLNSGYFLHEYLHLKRNVGISLWRKIREHDNFSQKRLHLNREKRRSFEYFAIETSAFD